MSRAGESVKEKGIRRHWVKTQKEGFVVFRDMKIGIWEWRRADNVSPENA